MGRSSNLGIGIGMIAATMVLAVSCAGCIDGCGAGYSAGKRTGTIVKFSEKGLVWKSWEGTMHLGVGAAATGANSWDFSVTDKKAIGQIQKAMDSNESVMLNYRQWLFHPLKIESQYEVIEAGTP